MYIKEIDADNKVIKVAIPLTNVTGKTRIKKRNVLNEYGAPVATKSETLTQSCYVEWQIGYDIPVKETEKASLTTIKDRTFIGANGKEKYLYELSEYIKYFYDWDIISKSDLEVIHKYLTNLPYDKVLDAHEDMCIKRSHLVEKDINEITYLSTKVEYPFLLYKFHNCEITIEIQIKEKQYAVGTQPMLYFCFPITELENSEKILNRTATTKEEATFVIDGSKKDILLDMIKIFGTLSINQARAPRLQNCLDFHIIFTI